MRGLLLWGLLFMTSNPQAETLQPRWFAVAQSPVAEELAADPAIESELSAKPVGGTPDYVGRLQSGKQQRIFLRPKGPQDSRIVSAIVDGQARALKPERLLEKTP